MTTLSTAINNIHLAGNGPSSILLSLMLSGHWPYFTGSHPNPYLTAKLQQNPDKSILEQVRMGEYLERVTVTLLFMVS